MRKIYDRAEKLLLKDKLSNAEAMKALSGDLEAFLTNYIVFDSNQFSLSAILTDSLVLTMQVHVKNFKTLNTSEK